MGQEQVVQLLSDGDFNSWPALLGQKVNVQSEFHFSKSPAEITEASRVLAPVPWDNKHLDKSMAGSVGLQAPTRLQMLYKQHHQHKQCHETQLRERLQSVLKTDSFITQILQSRKHHYN